MDSIPDPDRDEPDEGDISDGLNTGASRTPDSSTYATRRLMAVITALGEIQAELRLDQCQLWANRLVENARILARTETDILNNLREIKLNPFRHLGREEFTPLNRQPKETHILKAAHDQAAQLCGLEAFEGFQGESQ